MAITANQVKELRERTGAGMMECKKALESANGDIEAAIELMRKSGMAKAAKKADRTAAEGTIVIKLSADKHAALMLEVNCETDFVARDENFLAFANHVAERALALKETDITKLMSAHYHTNATETIEHVRQTLVAKLGENIQLRRLVLLQAEGIIGAYKHGERIGVLVQLDKANEQLGKDLAMHIAASNPLALNTTDVAADLVAKEREIASAQALSSGKPAAIIEKMIEGRINKFLNEVSLLGQPFVKNPDQTIAQLLQANQVKVTGFKRFEVGEGIEKVTSNFAEEVMAQVQGSR